MKQINMSRSISTSRSRRVTPREIDGVRLSDAHPYVSLVYEITLSNPSRRRDPIKSDVAARMKARMRHLMRSGERRRERGRVGCG